MSVVRYLLVAATFIAEENVRGYVVRVTILESQQTASLSPRQPMPVVSFNLKRRLGLSALVIARLGNRVRVFAIQLG